MTGTDSGVEVGKLDERVEVLEFCATTLEMNPPATPDSSEDGIPPSPAATPPFNKGGTIPTALRAEPLSKGALETGDATSSEPPPEPEEGPEGGAWEWQTVRRTWGRVTLLERKNVYSVHGIGAAGVTVILRRQPLTLDSALRWRGQHCLITAIRPLGRLYLSVEAALVELSQCRGTVTGATFPAVMTEEYVQHQQLEPMAVNTHRRVLVTPKAVRLAPGPLVEVDGTPWPVLTPYELDPHKNEYIIGRTVDL